MKIGLYFGSFNPIHIGHLIIANHILNHSDLDRIWFVISPQNPLKEAKTLLNEYDRIHLVHLAIENQPLFKASNVEFSLPKPSYTIDTLTYLKEQYPQHEFVVIMGSDSLENISKWKNSEALLMHYSFYIYIRPGFEIKNINNAKLTFFDAPALEISSTYIRNEIKKGKSIKFLLPQNVEEYILENGYYK